MGRIVFAGAMSHVLDPDYYDRACGAVGRQTVVAVMAEIARMGERLSARQPDALIVVAGNLRKQKKHAQLELLSTSTRCRVECLCAATSSAVSAALMVAISNSGGSLYAGMCSETNGWYVGSAFGSGLERRVRDMTSLA